MRLTFHLRQPFRKALRLASAVRYGAARHGDHVTIEQGFTEVRPTGLVMFGIGGHSRSVFDAYEGRPRVFFDKGYSRGDWVRVSVNAFQPLDYFQKQSRPDDRWRKLGIELQPYAKRGKAILFDGASNKYCLWQGLGDWIEWGRDTIDLIWLHAPNPCVIYRPRPSHNEPVRLPYAELSTGPLADDFARCSLVVSHGGNIGFDAAVAGVPHFAIGDSIARPISQTDWKWVGEPYVPDDAKRRQWCYDVAYCQWTLDEIERGEAWNEIRRQLLA